MTTKSIISSVTSQTHQQPWGSALVVKKHSSLPPLNPGFLSTKIIQWHLLLCILGNVYKVCLKILFNYCLPAIVSHFLKFLTYFLLVTHFSEIREFYLCKKILFFSKSFCTLQYTQMWLTLQFKEKFYNNTWKLIMKIELKKTPRLKKTVKDGSDTVPFELWHLYSRPFFSSERPILNFLNEL